MATVDVQPDDDKWVVVLDGMTRSDHRLKQAAVETGQRLARQRYGTLRIKRRDGSFQDIRRYRMRKG